MKYNIEKLGKREEVTLKSDEFHTKMEIIVSALVEKGYDPYVQLCGYLRENNPMYITKHRKARELVLTLDKILIQQFITKMK